MLGITRRVRNRSTWIRECTLVDGIVQTTRKIVALGRTLGSVKMDSLTRWGTQPGSFAYYSAPSFLSENVGDLFMSSSQPLHNTVI